MGSYPRGLEEIVTTSDGQRLLLRPVRPEDAQAFRANFPKFSPESVRRRFFAPLKTLTRAAAAKLTQIDYRNEMAFVLTDPVPPESGPPEGYGVGRIIIEPNGQTAEFAIIVRDDMSGKGLGGLLLRRLIAYARERRVRELVADVLPDNHRMLTLAGDFGFTVETRPYASDPVRVRLRLDELGPPPAA